MAFTDKQAAAKAKQIFDRFGSLIHAACVGTGVAESFLAGFTGVEAGIDRQGNIVPDATRFEPGVYHHLISVRDGLLPSYDHVTHRDLAGMTDDAIRNLSTSWGCTQIMGWHMVHDLTGTVEDLRDLDKHFGYTVQLLKIVGGHYMRDGDLTSVLHIWNTGNANGKTYHEDYVTNAFKVKQFYDRMLAANPITSTISAAVPAVAPSKTDDPADEPLASEADSQTSAIEQPPPSTVAADPDPQTPSTLDALTAKADKLSEWQEKLGKLNPTNYLPTMPSGTGTKVLTWGGSVWAGIMFVCKIIYADRFEFLAAAVIVALAVLYFWHRSRERNNPKGAVPAEMLNTIAASLPSDPPAMAVNVTQTNEVPK